MSALKIIGIVLIVAGVAMLSTGGFHFKEKKKVLDTDVVDISRTETRIVTWPRIAGVVVIVGGVALLLLNKNDKNTVA
jgi:drug/metabolite transporter (DMT)-like permease